jgi:hypothetical protein
MERLRYYEAQLIKIPEPSPAQSIPTLTIDPCWSFEGQIDPRTKRGTPCQILDDAQGIGFSLSLHLFGKQAAFWLHDWRAE